MGVYTSPATYLEQTHFQLYQDASGLNNAPPLAGVDAAAAVTLGQKFRCRLQIYSSSVSVTRYLLEYRVNGGTWRAADATEAVLIVDSTVFANGDATTSRIGYAGATFVGGDGIDIVRNSRDIVLGPNQYTEIEWNLTVVGLTIGDIVDLRAVAMSTAWSGGQSYTATPLIYDQIAAVVISGSSGEVSAAMMYEAYTEIGVGIEGASAFGKWVPAIQRINAVARLPVMSPSKLPYGGFRGIDAPVGVIMGQMPPAGITLQMEATPDQLGKFLSSLFGAPSTTGTGPYTHNFLAGNAPVTLTLWQKEHYSSDDAGAPVFSGFGGCIFSDLALEADVRAGGILQASFTGMAATYLLHNNASTVGMNSAYGNAQPFTVEGATLTIKNSSGSTPSWAGEIQSVRMRLARQNVYPRFGFDGKAIAKGYAYRRAVQLVELSIEVYRVGLKPLKLVLGAGEGSAYPIVPQPNVQQYDPATGGALQIVFTSRENSAWTLTLETPRFAWIELSNTSGGAEPMMDTYALMPIAEASATLLTVSLVNANSTEPGAAGTPLTISDSGPYSPF